MQLVTSFLGVYWYSLSFFPFILRLQHYDLNSIFICYRLWLLLLTHIMNVGHLFFFFFLESKGKNKNSNFKLLENQLKIKHKDHVTIQKQLNEDGDKLNDQAKKTKKGKIRAHSGLHKKNSNLKKRVMKKYKGSQDFTKDKDKAINNAITNIIYSIFYEHPSMDFTFLGEKIVAFVEHFKKT